MQRRKDNKGRVLKDGEVYRKSDGLYTPILRQTMYDFVQSKKSVVRVCAAKRSNESPSGAFKRPNGLALARWRGLAPTSSRLQVQKPSQAASRPDSSFCHLR